MASRRSTSAIDVGNTLCASCNQPPDESGEAWVDCYQCHTWYHIKCSNANPDDEQQAWLCSFCTTEKKKLPRDGTVPREQHNSVVDALNQASLRIQKADEVIDNMTRTQDEIAEERDRIVIEKDQIADENVELVNRIKALQARLEVKERVLKTPLPSSEDKKLDAAEASRRATDEALRTFQTSVKNLDTKIAGAAASEASLTSAGKLKDTKFRGANANFKKADSWAGQQGERVMKYEFPPMPNPQQTQPAVKPEMKPVMRPEVQPAKSVPMPTEMNVIEKFMLLQDLVDLPKFNGSDKQWPLFLSAYNRSVSEVPMKESRKLARLEKALEGEARELVIMLLSNAETAESVMDLLKDKYGRVDETLKRLTNEMLRWTPIPAHNKAALEKFATGLTAYSLQLKAMGKTAEISNDYVLGELVEKLAKIGSFYAQWKSMKEKDPKLDIADLGKFLREKARHMPATTQREEVKKDTSRGAISKARNTHTIDNKNSVLYVQPNFEDCAYCQAENSHHITTCRQFKKLTPKERYDEVVKRRLCFRCLRADHLSPACQSKTKCDEPGCGQRHHSLLHLPKRDNKEKPKANLNREASSFVPRERQSEYHAPILSWAHQHPTESGGFLVTSKVVAVRIHGNDGRYVDTHAFLDDGSELTMMDQSIAKRLGYKGTREKLTMRWTGDIKRTENALVCNVQVEGLKSRGRYDLSEVYCVTNLNLAPMSQNGEELARRYKHLRGLPLPEFDSAKPEMLIGLSHAEFLNGPKLYEGEPNEPLASKTKLGWVVYGRQSQERSPQILSQNQQRGSSKNRQQKKNREAVLNVHHRLETDDERLHDLVKNFFAAENVGVNAKLMRSKEDERAELIMRETMKQVEGRYEIGLLWKEDNIQLPDSTTMARKRLEAEERKLRRDPESLQWMNGHVQTLIAKGYARKATERDLTTKWERTWTVPMFIVVNQNKIPPKRRVVADAAAKANQKGESLNSFLLKGPDNLIPLLAALCRVREQKIMVNMDVQEMFHQVRIIEEDQQCQRFLWRDGDARRDPEIFVMQAMLFGPTCSPAEAQFVKNQHAQKYCKTRPEAAEALQRFTYADDYFNSHATIEEAVRVTNDAIQICAEMGFSLVQGQSNSQALLEQLPEGRAKEAAVSLNGEGPAAYTTKILGMHWHPNEDVLVFKKTVEAKMSRDMSEGRAPTKREMLSTLMRVFDPLGLAAKYVIRGKMVLQEVWRQAIGWDEQVNDELVEMWRKFLESLDELAEIKIPRWYAPINPLTSDVTLVIFVDASEGAFAATGYLRFQKDEEVFVALAMAKTKVAPLKKLSIPRLELQGALLGARLSKTIMDMQSFEISRLMLLSDSTCTLAWIENPTSKLNTFVSHRVAEIDDLTNSGEWYKIPTALNVADDATKNDSKGGDEKRKRWFEGASFMKDPISSWPIHKADERKMRPEEKVVYVNSHLVEIRDEDEHFVNKISLKGRMTWEKLVRVTAWILRFARRQTRLGYLTSAERSEAELAIFGCIQQQSFAQEWTELHEWTEGGSATSFDRSRLGSKSKLRNLPLTMRAGENVIRLEARDKKSVRAYGAKNPVMLPSSHPLVDLFVQYHHERNHHIGTETVIADLRETTWILAVRETHRRVVARCGWCKKQKVKPIMPPIADLHKVRMMFSEKPFTYVGVDLFGPIDVKRGRGTIKRWGAIFTCLTFRAVRLEVVDDLTTDQILRALRRLMVIRGNIRRVDSDNGTNFVGASNVLKNENQRMQKVLGEKAARDLNIDWFFNPAYSPWTGGAWERLIGYIKKSLLFTLQDETPSETELRDALSEAERIVNKRPLTHTPVSADDEEPLTPNMVLFGSNDAAQAIGEYDASDRYSRLSRDRVRHLIEKFGGRWETEYLPKIAKADARKAAARQIRVGDVVYLTESTDKRSAWRMGRVVKIHDSSDGVPRIVDVKLGNGEIKERRSVGNLAVLVEMESSAPQDVFDGGGNVAEPNQH